MSGTSVTTAEQGGLETLRIDADDLPSAHAALGEQLRAAIAGVVEQRLANHSAAELTAQLRAIRLSRAHLERRAAAASLEPALRRAIRDYLTTLAAWARGADLGSLRYLARRSGATWSAEDIALWLQDDNTGCQTGVVRDHDGSVLLWHTEEDTIGLFDRARLVQMNVGAAQLTAFLYPYLMPGPAFGWHARGLFAYDTLSVRRTAGGGTPTSALSWILWSTQGELAPLSTASALAPFLDGGAFTVVQREADGTVSANVIEAGGTVAVGSSLSSSPGARRLQVNMVSAQASELAPLETLADAERAPYVERLARSGRHLDACTPNEAALSAMLASREGGEWAFANEDVVAHLIARVSADEITLGVGVGAAGPAGGFAASYVLR